MSDIPSIDINIPKKREKRKKGTTGSLMSVHMEGYEVIEKEVKASGGTGRVYLPNDWIGANVKIVRISPIKGDVIPDEEAGL